MSEVVPVWRREPYRLFFPLGMLLLWAGVLHWLLVALGVIEGYRSIFHAMTQIQSVMASFAVGFLYTLIPRRTGGAPPNAVEIGVALVAPIGTSLCAWFEKWALAQTFWLALMITLIVFAARRMRGAARERVPDSFVWVAAGIFDGTVVAVMTGVAAARGAMWLHDIGRAMLLQGMFACLVLGIGSMLLPILTRGEPPPAPGARSATAKLAHALAAALFLASFLGEPIAGARGLSPVIGLQIGAALRAAIAATVLVVAAKAWRLPTATALHRWMAWIGAWMLPLGFALVAALPGYKRAALHVVFIGCYATLVFAISTHVILSHGGHPTAATPLPVVIFAALLAITLFFRVMVDVDAAHFMPWLGAAASSLLLATIAWAVFLVPKLFGEPVPGA
ncbi:MAG TPA: NnrS family protein [bacterium]|nr:NnrS family protein [bacterium]